MQSEQVYADMVLQYVKDVNGMDHEDRSRLLVLDHSTIIKINFRSNDQIQPLKKNKEKMTNKVKSKTNSAMKKDVNSINDDESPDENLHSNEVEIYFPYSSIEIEMQPYKDISSETLNEEETGEFMIMLKPK